MFSEPRTRPSVWGNCYNILMDYSDYLRLQKEKKENPSMAPSSVVMELRAGTGGDEANIFAHDLKNMYQKYAERRGWKTRNIDFLSNN